MATEFPDVIELNVGGKLYTTMLSTLCKYEDSMLAAMFSGRHVIHRDKDCRYMIDCDGNSFGHILEFLRFGTLPPSDVSEAVHRYAEYFGLKELSSKLLDYKQVRIAFEVNAINIRNPLFLTVINKVIDLLKPVKYGHIANTIIVIVHVSERPTTISQTNQAGIRQLLYTPLVDKEDQTQCLQLNLFTDEFNFHTTDIAELLFVVTHYLQEHGYGKRIGYSCLPHSSLPFHSRNISSDIGYIQIYKDYVDSKIDLNLSENYTK